MEFKDIDTEEEHELKSVQRGSTSVRGVLEDAGAAISSSPINISNSAKEEENANFPGRRSSPALAETGLKGIGRVQALAMIV
ncbi:hypothetical protein F0562_007681 [Nyssa sinensis]|uniref:Uncharacterized protein n=1 Tax=Nyssa sinensis TaxID=561372 RepID=A0A5J5A7F9_9ASTE|nr:hypothetical protein F0562_007681 [Nyssa sinensis]